MGLNYSRLVCLITLCCLMAAPSMAGYIPGDKVVVSTADAGRISALVASGARLIADRGSYVVLAVPTASGKVSLAETAPPDSRPDFDRIELRRGAIRVGGVSLASVSSSSQDEPGLALIQFAAPPVDSDLAIISAAGAKIVQYIPQNAYIVWTTPQAAAALQNALASSPVLQYFGPYTADYALEPSLDSAAGSDAPVAVTIQLFNYGAGAAGTLKQITDLASSEVRPAYQAVGTKYTNITINVAGTLIRQIAELPGVVNVERFVERQLSCERQGQIIASNMNAGRTQPTGPGYLAWLASKGFPEDPLQYPVVVVTDDGFDNGSAAAPGNPEFRQSNNAALPSRVAFAEIAPGGASSISTPNGVAGHGNINCSIVGGYNASTSFPYEDTSGYNYGLGISPFGRLASTKVFSDSGAFGASINESQMVSNQYAAGVRISSNSWGASVSGSYTTDAQMYDSLVRDSQAGIAGNQPMAFFFSAGNDGPEVNSIGSPGTAKNVITVGASENYNSTGVTDGCGIGNAGADSAQDIISFSSRGPCDDGRIKPEIVGPGTHIQGAASTSTSPAYDGSGVCDKYMPSGQTLYAWSSGTSHSCPALAGCGSLVSNFLSRQLGVTDPSPALLKAYLIHAAHRLTGASGTGNLPTNDQGYGIADLGYGFDASVQRQVVDQTWLLGASGEVYETSEVVGDSTKPVIVSLAWTDAPGATTGNSYVNDLDLEVEVAGQLYRGNVMSGDVSQPGGTADLRNNYEVVRLPAGISGQVTVRVRGTTIAGDGVPGNADVTDQDFALVLANLPRVARIGRVSLDRNNYTCSATAQVELRDLDLKGMGSHSVGITTSTGDSETLTLAESQPPLGILTGSINLTAAAAVPGDGVLQVQHLGTLTVTYQDADNGAGSPATATFTATSDCQPPQFAGIASATPSDHLVTLSWAAASDDSLPVTYAVFRATSPGGQNFDSPIGNTRNLSFQDTGVTNGTVYYYVVRALDYAGNAETNLVERSARPIGPLDHFSFTHITTPQMAGSPFGVTITAVDRDGNRILDFGGLADLAALPVGQLTQPVLISEIQPETPDMIEFTNVAADPVDVSGWTIDIYDYDSWPAPVASVTVPAGSVVPFGGVFTLEEYGTAPGSYPALYAGVNINWTNSSTSIAVLVRDAAGGIIDFATTGTSSSIISPVSIPSSEWSGAGIAVGGSTFQRVGVSDNNNASDWTIATQSVGAANAGLTLPFGQVSANVPVSPVSTEAFVQGAWAGAVTVLADTPAVRLKATGTGGKNGFSNSFEVRIGRSGVVALEQDIYSCSGQIGVQAADADLIGAGTATVALSCGQDTETVTLTEIPDSGGKCNNYASRLPVASGPAAPGDGVLQVSHGATITATYVDADDGQTNTGVARTDSATADCQPPVISNVQVVEVAGSYAVISFSTNEPATGSAAASLSCGGTAAATATGSSGATTHLLKVAGLAPGTTYHAVVSAADSVGNSSSDNNQGACYAFTTSREVELPSGGSTSTWVYPMATYYHDARTQAIYTASELGTGPVFLTSLSLNVTKLPGQSLGNWTIRLRPTDLSQYSSATWESADWTVVYQSNQMITSTGWNRFEFVSPYYFDGVSNLMVDFSFNNSSYTTDGLCLAAAPGGNRSVYFRTDSGFGDPLEWSGTSPAGTLGTLAPFIRLTIADAGPVTAPPSIDPPSGDYPDPISVSLTCPTAGAAIRYTVDGSIPTETSSLYQGPFTLSESCTLKARAFAEGRLSSATVSRSYVIAEVYIPAPPATAPTQWPYPLASYYEDARTQVIYLASELGGRRSQIKSLSLNVLDPPGMTLGNFKIRMKHTDLDSYGVSEWDCDGWTTVYESDESINTAGWRQFRFSQPFSYNGSDNLMVDFSFDNSDWSSDGLCAAFTASASRSLVFRTDSAYDDPRGWCGSTPLPEASDIVPQIRLAMDNSVATPEFDPSPRGFRTQLEVAISCATPGASVYYTIDGSEPTEQSYRYAAPITLYHTTTLKARAFKAPTLPSPVQSGTYTRGGVEAPIGPISGYWEYPMATYYEDARTQVIYTQEEIGASGLIRSIALDVLQVPGQQMNGWTIRMKHTGLAAFDGPAWEADGWTVVYQGNETIDTVGTIEFELTSPFQYNGIDNLMVDFSFNNSSYSSDGLCGYVDSGDIRAISYKTDSGFGDPLGWTGVEPVPYSWSSVPKAVFRFADDIAPVTVDTPGKAKLLQDETLVTLEGCVVSAVNPAGSGCLYVQDPAQSSGIAVVPAGGSFNIGDLVVVEGVMSTAGAERVIVDAAVTTVGGPQPPAPVMMQARCVGGADWFYDPLAREGQPGAASTGIGLNSVGLLAQISGKVVSVDQSSGKFEVWDGSFWWQSSPPSGGPGKTGISCCAPLMTLPAQGETVTVTGVVSCYKEANIVYPGLLVRQQSDIAVQ